MVLWTIQPREVYTCIQNTGRYICVPGKTPNIPDFRYAYGWLNKKMKARVGVPPDGISYPVWAWHTYDGKRKKPDLRHSGYEEKGKECVCLEIEVPDKDVVLSDFDGWHFVLDGFRLKQNPRDPGPFPQVEHGSYLAPLIRVLMVVFLLYFLYQILRAF